MLCYFVTWSSFQPWISEGHFSPCGGMGVLRLARKEGSSPAEWYVMKLWGCGIWSTGMWEHRDTEVRNSRLSNEAAPAHPGHGSIPVCSGYCCMKVISRGVPPCLSWCGFGEEHRARCFPTITSKAVLGMPWSRRMAVRRFKCKQPLCPGRVRQCLMRVCPVRPCQSRNLENWPPVVQEHRTSWYKKPYRCLRQSFPPSSCALVESTLRCSSQPVIFVEWSEVFRWNSCVVLISYCVPCRRQRD